MSEIKTVRLGAKASDMFDIEFISAKYRKSGDGYAPDIKGLCGGDYLDVEIDNATGKIVGWVPIEAEEVDELLEQM